MSVRVSVGVSVSKVCEGMSVSVSVSVSVWKCVIMSVKVEGVCVSVRSPSLWNSDL